MKEKSIERSIVKATNIPKSVLPLDVLLIKGNQVIDIEKKESPLEIPIKIKAINYKGTIQKVPYSPISTIYSIDF